MKNKKLKLFINEIQEGNDEHFENVFLMYEPLVYNIKHKFILQNFDLDDYSQESRFVCYQAILGYDCKKPVTFGLYYKIMLERHFISLLRRQEAKKRLSNKFIDSIDDIGGSKGKVNVLDDLQAARGSDIANWENYIYIRENILTIWEKLSELEYQVFLLYLSGLDLDEIAIKLAVDLSVTRNAFSRSKKKFKELLKENNL
ncbi:hypothetical protein ACWOAH_03975 [Vagococcus vulneris]|uniref:RNA polymerase sigma factor SigS n=1 Tax=Vagococcus vulneris TaxID=1977869 RepID=A0A430A0J4_9ENTE|nr:hypothetical protein [Vagococcus vulneris]RST99857.1 hypothetical protein CBF37_03810 [Vagococcus vulneris]